MLSFLFPCHHNPPVASYNLSQCCSLVLLAKPHTYLRGLVPSLPIWEHTLLLLGWAATCCHCPLCLEDSPSRASCLMNRGTCWESLQLGLKPTIPGLGGQCLIQWGSSMMRRTSKFGAGLSQGAWLPDSINRFCVCM